MTKRLADRVFKIEQRKSAGSIRYVLRGNEQPTAAEIAIGQRFVRMPIICATTEEWLERYVQPAF